MSYSFAYPWVLGLLVLVPLMAVYLFLPRLRRRHVGTFRFSALRLLSAQRRSLKSRLQPLPDILLLIAVALMIVALARPQILDEQQVDVEGIDIYLTLDMSGSMRAIDLDEDELQQLLERGEEPVDRFDSAVDVLKRFVKNRSHDRIGMVVFARDAFLQFPLTLDYNAILGMLDELKIGDIEPGGTAIGNAIGRSTVGLKNSDAETKIMILITDGDRRGGNISPKQAAEIAKKLDIKVFPILVGREGPVLVPVQVRTFMGQSVRYQKAEFPVNPPLLKEIAEMTGGEYYHAEDAETLDDQLHTILDRFKRTRLQSAADVGRRELFGPLIIWALLLVAGQALLRYTVLRTYP